MGSEKALPQALIKLISEVGIKTTFSCSQLNLIVSCCFSRPCREGLSAKPFRGLWVGSRACPGLSGMVHCTHENLSGNVATLGSSQPGPPNFT